jgi:hypothetical protein
MQEKGDVHQTDARKDKNSKHLAGARGGDGTVGEFVDDPGAVIEERRGTAHVGALKTKENDVTRHLRHQEMQSTRQHARRRGKWSTMFGKSETWYAGTRPRVSVEAKKMYKGNGLTRPSFCTMAKGRSPCRDDSTSRVGTGSLLSRCEARGK